jgi:hypothetical protein
MVRGENACICSHWEEGEKCKKLGARDSPVQKERVEKGPEKETGKEKMKGKRE